MSRAIWRAIFQGQGSDLRAIKGEMTLKITAYEDSPMPGECQAVTGGIGEALIATRKEKQWLCSVFSSPPR